MCDTVESPEADMLKLEYGLLGTYPDRVVATPFFLCLLGVVFLAGFLDYLWLSDGVMAEKFETNRRHI